MKGMDLDLKKVIINIVLILTFLVIYLLQINFFSWFKIAGIMPNLFVIYILFIGLFISKTAGATYGIALGILLDLFIGKHVGISAIMLGVVGLIGGFFDKNFSKESRITIMIMVVISTFIYETGAYILSHFIQNATFEFFSFLKILSIECVYNVIITIIVYPWVQALGYKVEEEYKGNKILTRYF